jgi:hypothetical protein
MAVLAPMKNTTPIDGFIGDGDFSNVPPARR